MAKTRTRPRSQPKTVETLFAEHRAEMTVLRSRLAELDKQIAAAETERERLKDQAGQMRALVRTVCNALYGTPWRARREARRALRDGMRIKGK